MGQTVKHPAPATPGTSPEAGLPRQGWVDVFSCDVPGLAVLYGVTLLAVDALERALVGRDPPRREVALSHDGRHAGRA